MAATSSATPATHYVMVNAERYYRTMMTAGAGSWNLRDTHMMETLKRLLQRHGEHSKGIVWAHNTHVGDARATDMRHEGMFNLGQLARAEWGAEQVRLVGFGGRGGSVVAGRGWGSPAEKMLVPPAPAHSWEGVMHRALGEDSLLPDLRGAPAELRQPRGHRAIGVVYQLEYERGNYVPTELAERYDAFVYLDETRALHPLHIAAAGEVTPPDTYPWGF